MKNWMLLALLASAPAAFASDENWYTIPLSYFRSMTLSGNNSAIILQSPTGSTNTTIAVATDGGGAAVASVSQVTITPPAGREKEWESLILTSMSLGASIKVTGKITGTEVKSPSVAGITPFINFLIP
jgi:hypothetical protein